MNRRLTLVAAVGTALLLTTACAERFDATRLGVPATLAEPAGQAVQGDTFRVTQRSVHLLWGLLPASRASLERALAGQALDSPQVHSVKIHVRSRWSDLLFTVLTAGIVVPRAVTYEGVVVRRQDD